MALLTFPELAGIAFPVKRSPIWSTITQRSPTSGKQVRLQQWHLPLYKYQLTYDHLRSDNVTKDWQTLVGFYNRVGGPAKNFMFEDVDDKSVTDQGLGAGDGATRSFQLVRAFGNFVEEVHLPTITDVKIDGVVTELYTLQSGGIVTFNTAPALGQVLTWSGTYKWLCHFTEDTIEFSKFSKQFWELGSITLETQRP